MAAGGLALLAGAPAESRAAAGGKPNVLVIVVDTLRADALGLYGQKRPTSPNIDKLARESLVWDTAWTQYTWTLPSFASYMTSTHARTHGWAYKMSKLDEYHLFEPPASPLPEVFGAAGYARVGVYSNQHILPDLGFGRGFDVWQKGADVGVVRAALADLKKWPTDGKPNFLYVHLVTPHVPLVPSDTALRAIGSKYTAAQLNMVSYGHWSEAPEEQKAQRLEELREAYLGSVRDADTRVGEVLAALDATGERDNTVVAFFSDHGELLGEHSLAGHATSVWDEVARVPLIVRAPGRSPARITDRVGRLIDVAPTLTEAAGLPAAAGWQGISLFKSGVAPLAVSERDAHVAFTIDGSHKVVQDRAKGTFLSAFDLKSDPDEGKSVTDRALTWVQGAEVAAQAWRTTTPLRTNPGALFQPPPERRDEAMEQLRALGYTE